MGFCLLQLLLDLKAPSIFIDFNLAKHRIQCDGTNNLC